MAGRKPKPTHLKLVDGNPGKRPINRNEVEVDGDLDDAPTWLSQDQKKAWRYAIDNAPAGMLKRLDRSVLTAWVVAEDLHRQATIALATEGLLTKSPVKGDPMQNPYLPIINRQATLMMKAASELGFSPTSRTRVAGEGAGKGQKKDNAEKYNL
ncbi:MAG: phage terminase small subunit P27 family [Dokdonella sp.]